MGKAGEGPGRGGKSGRAKAGGAARKVGLLILAAAVALATIPRIGPVKNPVQQKVTKARKSLQKTLNPKYKIVHATSASATSSDPSHPPALAIDGKKNTFWAVDGKAGNDGIGQVLKVSFAEPINLSQMGFTIGPLAKPEDFLTQPRPATVHIVLTDASGKVVGSKDLSLDDKDKFQAKAISGKNVSTAQIAVSAVHKSAVGHQVSLAEVEFYKKV